MSESSTLAPSTILEPGHAFMTGDEAIAYGALYAGCTFFAGYPITPASEIAETLSEELPKTGGRYVQMEDELGSIAAAIGASWTGKKAMTATSGPGFSLMQENLGYAVMTETPLVLIDVQRSGPSTGQATLPAQGDVQQARWGSHGDHPKIVLSPSSVQEAFDMTVRAFNLAERYRIPVVVLADGQIGHASESLTIPDSVSTDSRTVASETDETFFGDSSVAPMPVFGEGLRAHVTGSTHEPDGMREVRSHAVHDDLIRGIHGKIERNVAEITDYDAYYPEADEMVVSFGITGRTAKGAVERMRDDGHDIGLLLLKTLWPFPDQAVTTHTNGASRVYVPELNLGQLAREVERVVDVPVTRVDRIGGNPWSVTDLIAEFGGDL